MTQTGSDFSTEQIEQAASLASDFRDGFDDGRLRRCKLVRKHYSGVAYSDCVGFLLVSPDGEWPQVEDGITIVVNFRRRTVGNNYIPEASRSF